MRGEGLRGHELVPGARPADGRVQLMRVCGHLRPIVAGVRGVLALAAVLTGPRLTLVVRRGHRGRDIPMASDAGVR